MLQLHFDTYSVRSLLLHLSLQREHRETSTDICILNMRYPLVVLLLVLLVGALRPHRLVQRVGVHRVRDRNRSAAGPRDVAIECTEWWSRQRPC